MLTLLNLGHESLGWLEGGDEMLGDGDRGVLRDVASSFLCTLADYEATEATKVYVLTLCQGLLNNLHESLYGHLNRCLFNAGAFGNLVDDVCFCHLCTLS